MRTTTGICYLGQHVKTGDYILLQFGRDKLLHILVAPIIPVPLDKMEADGISLILSYLRSPIEVKRGELTPSQKIPKEELLKTKRKHLLIEIGLEKDDSEMIQFVPLHGGHGFRFDVNKDEMKLFPLPMANAKFMEYLKTAFEIAS
jgi:hypothetical protein